MFASAALLGAETKDPRVYEMRIYYAAPGKLDDLNKRFRDHTLRLWQLLVFELWQQRFMDGATAHAEVAA